MKRNKRIECPIMYSCTASLRKISDCKIWLSDDCLTIGYFSQRSFSSLLESEVRPQVTIPFGYKNNNINTKTFDPGE